MLIDDDHIAKPLARLFHSGANCVAVLALLAACGKGSHETLRFGNRKTTLKDLRKEIGVGLLHVMLGQLGLSRGDLDK